MATYYKYAERQADSFVNWAEIGKGITDMISTETKIREDKKAAIDEASRKLGEQLSNAPSGEHQGMNSWTLNYANDAQQARLIQDRLLKAGQLNLKDYTVMRQNINDGTTQLFNLAKEYQEEYKTKMERLKSNDPNAKSQDLEAFFMETVEGFANFTKSKAVINPTNFQVSIGLMKKNPKTGVMELSDEFATVSDLRNRIKGRFDYFNSRAASETVASGFAKFIDSEIEQGKLMGKVVTVEDAMKRKGFTDSLDDAINSQVANPYNITSILTNDIKVDEKGQQYTFTFNQKEAGGNVIYLEMDEISGTPKPVFTKEQEDAAKSFLKGQILQRIEYEKQIKPFSIQQPQQPQQWQFLANEAKKQELNIATNLSKLYTGTSDEVEAVADFFRGINENIDTVNRQKNFLEITYKDGRQPERIDLVKNGQPVGVMNFLESSSNFLLPKGIQITNINELAQRGGLTGGQFNPTVEVTSAPSAGKFEPVDVSFPRAVLAKTGITSSIFVDDEDATVNNVSQAIASLPALDGYTVEAANAGSDEIVIRKKDVGEVARFNLDGITPADANRYLQTLINLSSKEMDEVDKAVYVKDYRQRIDNTSQRRTQPAELD